MDMVCRCTGQRPCGTNSSQLHCPKTLLIIIIIINTLLDDLTERPHNDIVSAPLSVSAQDPLRYFTIKVGLPDVKDQEGQRTGSLLFCNDLLCS